MARWRSFGRSMTLHQPLQLLGFSNGISIDDDGRMERPNSLFREPLKWRFSPSMVGPPPLDGWMPIWTLHRAPRTPVAQGLHHLREWSWMEDLEQIRGMPMQGYGVTWQMT